MIKIIIEMLFFWRRGAKGDASVALSLKEQEQACRAYARAAGYKVVAGVRERRGGQGPRGSEFEKHAHRQKEERP